MHTKHISIYIVVEYMSDNIWNIKVTRTKHRGMISYTQVGASLTSLLYINNVYKD
jgi:hypothetical protein